tara:strand:- start:685 stop:894 length:210 start_codon:yes stop_codon:yes gene_type:complete
MKSFKEYEEGVRSQGKYPQKSFSKMSDKELIKWLADNWTDESGISKVFGGQLKNASKEASKRKLKWTMK